MEKNTNSKAQIETIIVSYGSNIESSILEQNKLGDVLEIIKSNDQIKNIVDKIRNLPTKEERERLKKDLPYFNLGTFQNNKRNNQSFIQTQYMLFDLDKLEDVESAFNDLKNDPKVFLAFRSPSGNGIKFTIRLAESIIDYKKYSCVYKAIEVKHFGKFLDYFDKGAHDAARACFFSHDPDLYINYDSEPVEVDVEIESSKEKSKSPKKKEILNALEPQTPGARTGSMTQLIGVYIAQGFDKEFTLDFIRTWNKSNQPPHSDEKIVSTVNDMYGRYQKESDHLPLNIIVQNNCYLKSFKKGKTSESMMMSSFIIEPKELLVLENSDCLKCDIKSSGGYEYPNVLIENTDWHSKSKFLKSIGHQDCVFLGSDNDLQILCNYINSKIPIRKKGTKVIGLHDDRWVVKGMNITKKGIEDESIVPFEKGADAFYNKIKYKIIPDNEYNLFIQSFYENILKINDQAVITPWVGWSFASVVKPQITEKTGSFPLAFVHGGQGSGKTTTGMLFSRLFGYTDPKPHSCTMRSFPMLKLLSSTNAIPILLDEYKEQDMRDEQVDNITRYMRKLYSGEIESKGRPDLSVDDYNLTAPAVVMGEWSITQPAIKERILLIRFSNVIKSDPGMQKAYKAINDLPLESFMPEYIKFCLNQNISDLYDQSKDVVDSHFSGLIVAPRIKHNLSCMVLGIELFKLFGISMGISVPVIDVKALLDSQLKEITGSKTGFVKSAVDQLLEELSIMAGKGKISQDIDYRFIKPDPKNTNSTQILAIGFNRVFPEFKMWAKQTSFEGDILDKESYVKLFDDCDYITNKSMAVRFNKQPIKALCIDYKKAIDAGLDLDGFVTSVTECNQEPVTEISKKNTDITCF